MARYCPTVGPMRRARIAWPLCGSLSTGENGFLNQVVRMLGDDILRAIEAMNTWFVVMIVLVGVGALTLHGYDMRHVLIWAFGWFVLGALLPGYRGGHL